MENQKLEVKRLQDLVHSPSTIQEIFREGKLLAVARSNNSIDVWDIENWIQILRIPGFKTIDTRRIIINEGRIFTSGLSGFLVEWDLDYLKPKKFYSTIGHSIWDMCFDEYFYLGCDDGVVRVVDLSLQIVKLYSQVESISSIVSCGKYIYTGHLNGTINKWKEGVIKSTFGNKAYTYNKKNTKMQIDDESNEVNVIEKETKEAIWKLCIANNVLAAGTSSGELQLWDCTFGVLKASFKEHNSDILTIKFNLKYNVLYYTGCDSLVVSIIIGEELKLQSSIRPQSHDIYSLELYNDTLISGGVTTDLCLIKLDKGRFLESYGKYKLNYNKQKRHISCFEKDVFSMKRNSNQLKVLQRNTNSIKLFEYKFNENKYKELFELNSSSDENILSCGMNNDSSIIYYSNSKETVFFKFHEKKLAKLLRIKHSSNYCYFTKEYAILINNKEIVKVNLKKMSEQEISEEVFKFNHKLKYLTSCDVNSNSFEIAFSFYEGEISIFNLTNNKFTLKENVKQVTFLKYIGTNLILVQGDNSIKKLDLETKLFSSLNVPTTVTNWYNKILGITEVNKELILAFTDYNLIPIHLNKESPLKSSIFRDTDNRQKSKSSVFYLKDYHNLLLKSDEKFNKDYYSKNYIREEENSNFKIITKFCSNIKIEYLEGVLFVVEIDWEDILSKMISPIVKRKFMK